MFISISAHAPAKKSPAVVVSTLLLLIQILNHMKDDFSKRKVFQEVYLLKKIKHSNVIRLLEVFESSKHLLMVMEYAGGGDLLKLIK